MDRTAFLERLFTMFPANFNENNIPYWSEAYEAVFGNSNINYDKMFKFMLAEHNNMLSAPSPKWFLDNKFSCIERDERCAAIRHIEEIKQTSEPMPEYIKDRMNALKEKMRMRAL